MQQKLKNFLKHNSQKKQCLTNQVSMNIEVDQFNWNK